MHPGNEANQDDRQIIRRPLLRAMARDGNKTTFTLVGRRLVDMVDHHNVRIRLGAIQLQPQLLL
jgi:hypothetical protein